MYVKLRYKDPNGTKSKLITKEISGWDYKKIPSENFKFASSVAEFGLLLRNSPYKGNASYDQVQWRAREADRKSTRLNSSHIPLSRMPSSA